MTLPFEHGYPDYGRYAARGDKLLFKVSNSSTNVLQTRGPWFVGDATHLNIQLSTNTNHANIRVRWASESTLTEDLGSFQLGMRAGSHFDRTIPVQGPWARIELEPVGGTPLDYSLSVSTAAGDYVHQRTPIENVLISVFNQNVPAATTLDFTAIHVWPGQAYLYTELPVANVEIRLVSISSAGLETVLARHIGSGTQRDRLVFLPAENARLKFVNGTGAAANGYFGFLTARPVGPGW